MISLKRNSECNRKNSRKKFFKKQRGSITVFVTLILVPTVFFTGFMVDLSRLKLYGNQAVMTADNYGEAVLSEYDNLLKELYGLFAITQDEEGLKQLDNLQKYMKSSFDPTENTISWNHLTELTQTEMSSGFMPYKDAEVTLDKEYVENANLRNSEVFATQIGDFMKFRIAQGILDDGSELIDMIDKMQNTENDAKAIDKKNELDKEVEELYELAQKYYEELKNFYVYPDYIKGINDAYNTCNSQIEEIIASDAYKHYKAYKTADENAIKDASDKKQRIEEAANHRNNITDTEQSEEPESLSSDEQNLLDIQDAYTNDSEARKEKLEKQFDDAITNVKDSFASDPIDFDDFETHLSTLQEQADKIASKETDIKTLQNELQNLLNENEISEDLKNGLNQDLERLNGMFEHIEAYQELVQYIKNNDSPQNEAYSKQADKIVECLEKVKETYLEGNDYEGEWEKPLKESDWKDFTSELKFNSLYQSLDKCFGAEAGSEERGEQKKKDAKELSKKAQDELSRTEQSSARNIPSSFGYGTTINDNFDLSNMIHSATNMLSFNGMKNELNRMLLKVYIVQYDNGMFSNRITNVKDSENTKQKSLTGYEMCKSINYLYQAELEYLLGGSNSSSENLNAARNRILAIRAVCNFTATYSVKEINTAINGISEAATAINPILGIAVNAALRMAVSSMETLEDWNALKKGESVVLIKTKIQQMTAYDKFASLLDMNPESVSVVVTDEGLKLDYTQYLKLMTIFLTSFDQLTRRTENLIELNVNAVKQDVGESGELSEKQFKMEEAHTAVNASCTVNLGFVVMPKGFAKSVVESDTYDEIEAFERKGYRFTVTRGY